jgi:hypothetical protein
MAKELKLFYRLFAKHLPDESIEIYGNGATSHICASDFNENIHIVPIADPHVTSEVQRLFRNQLIVDAANQSPDLHNRHVAYKMLYESMKLTKSQIKDLLPDPEDIQPLDPVTENQKLITSQAVKASIDQDHGSHKILHSMILNDPNTQPQIAAAVMAHIAEHTAFEFQIQIQQMISIQLPEDPTQLPMDIQNQIAMMAAQAIMQQQQQAQEEAPSPPIDPALVMLEEVKVREKGVDLKAESDQLKAETEAFKAQLNYEAEMKKLELDAKELELKSQGVI